MPVNEPITIYRGDDWAKAVEGVFTDRAPLTVGDWSARAQIRSSADATDAIDIGVALSVTGDADEVLTIMLTLADTVTADMAGPSSRVWDLEVTGPPGVVTWVRGPVTVTKDVSRA